MWKETRCQMLWTISEGHWAAEQKPRKRCALSRMGSHHIYAADPCCELRRSEHLGPAKAFPQSLLEASVEPHLPKSSACTVPNGPWTMTSGKSAVVLALLRKCPYRGKLFLPSHALWHVVGASNCSFAVGCTVYIASFVMHKNEALSVVAWCWWAVNRPCVCTVTHTLHLWQSAFAEFWRMCNLYACYIRPGYGNLECSQSPCWHELFHLFFLLGCISADS